MVYKTLSFTEPLIIQPSTKNNTLYNQVLKIIQNAVKSDVKTGRI